ncbi:MAG: AI-2E family transporter, partial [Candidatus Margulisiibacteriota bacterium]
ASGLVNIFSQFLKVIVIPVITFYLLKDKEKLYSGAMELLPKNHRHKTEQILEQINTVLTNYVKGELILCSVVGLMVGIGLYFLGVKFFLIFGLISAITEFIPVIGPFIGAVPAVIIAFLISPALALKVIILYLLVQAFENSLLVPRIMGDKMNLHPVTVILAILILGKLIGPWGLFFAAPIMAIIKITYLELSN